MALETSLYPDVFNDRLFNRACHLVKDAVPNIRMTIAKCFSLVLTKQSVDLHRHNVTVMILRKMQQDDDSDVRDIALSCELPATDEEINESARQLNETACDAYTDNSTLSTASTVDLNSTEGGATYGRDNDESDESQDSIRLYLDTDEKNMSKCSIFITRHCHHFNPKNSKFAFFFCRRNYYCRQRRINIDCVITNGTVIVRIECGVKLSCEAKQQPHYYYINKKQLELNVCFPTPFFRLSFKISIFIVPFIQNQSKNINKNK